MPDQPGPVEPPSRVELPEDEGFWRAVDENRLDLVRCNACGAWSSFARSCVQCGARDYSWVTASGLGHVRTFVVFHRAYHPHFAEHLPYNVAVVGLDEGPELITNVVDVEPVDIQVGMPIRIVFREHGSALLPQAAPLPA